MKYDQEIEVTEKQYNILKSDMCGVVAHRNKDGRFYIKVWLMNYVNEIKQIITNN